MASTTPSLGTSDTGLLPAPVDVTAATAIGGADPASQRPANTLNPNADLGACVGFSSGLPVQLCGPHGHAFPMFPHAVHFPFMAPYPLMPLDPTGMASRKGRYVCLLLSIPCSPCMFMWLPILSAGLHSVTSGFFPTPAGHLPVCQYTTVRFQSQL